MTDTRLSGAEPIREGLLVRLWSGDDLGIHSALVEELENAGIPFLNKPVGAYPGARHGTTDFVPAPAFGFEIEVFSSDLAAVRQILQRLTTPLD